MISNSNDRKRVASVAVSASDRDEPGELRDEHDDRRHRGGNRRNQNVAVVDVAQLVGEHAA